TTPSSPSGFRSASPTSSKSTSTGSRPPVAAKAITKERLGGIYLHDAVDAASTMWDTSSGGDETPARRDQMNTRMICRFATAYSAYCDATIKGDENSRLVWLDLYGEAADELGIPDSEHHGLADCRAEKKMR